MQSTAWTARSSSASSPERARHHVVPLATQHLGELVQKRRTVVDGEDRLGPSKLCRGRRVAVDAARSTREGAPG